MGSQSALHVHFGRVAKLFLKQAPGRATAIVECTEMEHADQSYYDSVFVKVPYLLGAEHWVPMLRRRLWWHAQEPSFPPGTILKQSSATTAITVAPASPRKEGSGRNPTSRICYVGISEGEEE